MMCGVCCSLTEVNNSSVLFKVSHVLVINGEMVVAVLKFGSLIYSYLSVWYV